MTPTQIKIALYAGAALLAWLFTRKAIDAVDPRVSKTLDVDVNVNSPFFGLTDEEIDNYKRSGGRNPAIDPGMREVIDRSNAILDAEDAE